MPDEQKPRMEKLIDGKVQVRKKSTGRKLMEVLRCSSTEKQKEAGE